MYIRTKITTHSPPCMRLSRMPLPILSRNDFNSLLILLAFRRDAGIFARFLPHIFLQTKSKLGFERSTSKRTSGSVATRASARDQTPRDGSLAFGARSKWRKRFRYPKRSISCIQPPAHLALTAGVGGSEEGAQLVT
jgi:hypothetical protein